MPSSAIHPLTDASIGEVIDKHVNETGMTVSNF